MRATPLLALAALLALSAEAAWGAPGGGSSGFGGGGGGGGFSGGGGSSGRGWGGGGWFAVVIVAGFALFTAFAIFQALRMRKRRRERVARVELLRGPEVEYLGLVNRAEEADDRVVVRVTSALRDVVVDRAGNRITRTGSKSETTTLSEYWTLGRRDGAWTLLSIEQDAEGAHHLDGSKERETTFTERWTLALDGAGPTPWRIVEAAAPARS